MNRYTAPGVTKDAAAGKRIIVIVPRAHDVRETLDMLLTHTPEFTAVTRANGSEGITYPTGGRIRIYPATRANALRGQTADIVVITDDALRSLPDDAGVALAATLRHTVTPNGEIIQA